MTGKTINELCVGDTAEFSKTVSESDVYLYAGITGDLNPAHIDEAYAKGTFFKKRIAHGMLAAGFISTVMGTKLPGPGTVIEYNVTRAKTNVNMLLLKALSTRIFLIYKQIPKKVITRAIGSPPVLKRKWVWLPSNDHE